MKKMSNISRLFVAVASLAMVIAFFVPVWFIHLQAPQYPEGLTMQIWLNKITGEVDIINGLNHYIGMKHISADMFPEFDFLTYILGAIVVLGLIVALIGNRKVLFAYFILLVLGGVAALYDFYRWGYDYGHNLDPKAAIQVPGLSYQPPVIGHKTLLNFDAYSYPDVGGWIVAGAGIVFFLVWLYEWRTANKKIQIKKAAKTAAVAMASIFLFASCTAKPEAFIYGKDACDECKMTIMDPKFGGEILTKKGRVYKFDDIHCMAGFLKSGKIDQANVAQNVFVDYEHEGQFLEASKAYFVVSPALKSPMNSNAAAFASSTAADSKAAQVQGKVVDWNTLLQSQ